MGGNALAIKSVRMSAADYDRTALVCVGKLRALYPQGEVAAIPSYRTKPDHGDLDVLIATAGYNPFDAAQVLGAAEVVRNGPVTSIGIPVEPDKPAVEGNVFQVDLISIDEPSFDYAYKYFSFNDLGNLVGRTAHKAGLSHKHDGLYFYVRNEDHKFRDIILTRDYEVALRFLGYDVEAFKRGFDTLEDIFKFVAGSKFFNRDIYLLENRNAQSRVRDRKRRTYMEFLKYCEAHPELPAYAYPENKSDWIPRIAEHFPGFQEEYDQALAEIAERQAVKNKFNGEWVASITGLEGKALGALLTRFRASFESDQAQRTYLLSESLEGIAERIRLIHADS